MLKNIKLTIPKTCSQSWDGMADVPSGKFCNSCLKNVSDFTNFSDRELLDYFQQSSGKVCGSLTIHQLERVLINSQPGRRRIIPKIVFSTALTLGAMNETNAKDIETETSQSINVCQSDDEQ